MLGTYILWAVENNCIFPCPRKSAIESRCKSSRGDLALLIPRLECFILLCA